MKCRIMRHFIWVFTVCKSTHCRYPLPIVNKGLKVMLVFPAIGFREVIEKLINVTSSKRISTLFSKRRIPVYHTNIMPLYMYFLVPYYDIIGKYRIEPWHEISSILTSVESNEPLQPPVKLRNSKRCSVSSLKIINTQATSKGSDHTARMYRLIWSFVGRTYHTVGNLMPWLR